MKLTFEQDTEKRKIIGRFVLGERYQGGGGMAHGGIIATLLDEAMGKVCRFREVRAVTAELSVEYLKPVGVQSEIVVEGWEMACKGRNGHRQSENARRYEKRVRAHVCHSLFLAKPERACEKRRSGDLQACRVRRT